MGDQVTVTATAKSGYNFVGWQKGDEIIADSSYTFVVDGDINLIALYNSSLFDDYKIDINKEDNSLKIKKYVGNKTTVEIPSHGIYHSVDYQVRHIGNEAFLTLDKLSNVVIPNGILTIGNRAFQGCGLFEINIPDSVTLIGDYAFQDCDRISSIVIPDNVISIGDCAFNHCGILSSVTFGSGSMLTKINKNVFSICTKLTSIALPSKIIEIGDEAFKMNKLTH